MARHFFAGWSCLATTDQPHQECSGRRCLGMCTTSEKLMASRRLRWWWSQQSVPAMAKNLSRPRHPPGSYTSVGICVPRGSNHSHGWLPSWSTMHGRRGHRYTPSGLLLPPSRPPRRAAIALSAAAARARSSRCAASSRALAALFSAACSSATISAAPFILDTAVSHQEV